MHSDLTSRLPVLDYINVLGKQAKQASFAALHLTAAQKNNCLEILANLLSSSIDEILEANTKDIKLAVNKNLSEALIDRLTLDTTRYQAMIDGVHTVLGLNDPVGEVEHIQQRPSGIRVGKMRVPIGVVAMIYESRPNVTIDAAALNIKAGNAVILRGGSESFYSNLALYGLLTRAVEQSGLPSSLVQFVENTSRESVNELVRLSDYVDLLIPRGGKGLIEKVSQNARVNVLKHLDGNCHVYVDSFADLSMATDIVWNAKTRRYGVCNAMESLLVHRQTATEFLPPVVQRLSQHGVGLRLCEESFSYARNIENAKPATEQDWYTEYLGPFLSIKLVKDIDQAIDHINQYGSHHTDAIVSNDYNNCQRFLAHVDSSSVMVNASTAFADGYEFGLGAEIGISTDKFHARGPVGLEGLTCQKYIVLGTGQIRP